MSSPDTRLSLLWVRCAGAAALCLVIALVFAPTFDAELVNWDDVHGIARNHALGGLDAERLEWMFRSPMMGHYQPLAWLSLALDHAVWGAPQLAGAAGGFHITSVVLHSVCALLFGLLARRVLARCVPGASARAVECAAWCAAAFFAVHPLRAESVAWLTERRDVLSGCLLVGAVLLWWRAVEASDRAPRAPRLGAAVSALVLAAVGAAAFFAAIDASRSDALTFDSPVLLALAVASWVAATLAASAVDAGALRRRMLLVASASLALLSLLAKAWGIVLPAVLLVLDMWPLSRLSDAPRARTLLVRLGEKAPFLALSVIFARLALWAQGSSGQTMMSAQAHTPLERALQTAFGLVWYPWKTLVPLQLSPHVPVPPDVSVREPRFAIALVLTVVGVLALLAIRRRRPAAPSAFAAFAVIVSPVLGIAQSGPQLVADRYSYLSCMPLALLLCGGVLAAHVRRPWLAWLAALLLPLAWLGTAQARVWRTSESLWEQALRVDPRNEFAAQKLAQAQLVRAGATRDSEERRALIAAAATQLERVRNELDPLWLSTQAQVLLERAQLEPERSAELRATAIAFSERALALQGAGATAEMRMNLATTWMLVGEAQRAVPLLEGYVEEHPYVAFGWVNLGAALAASGKVPEAIAPLRRAVELDPSYAKGWQFLARACEQTGERDSAREAWARVLELWPDSELARARLQALGRP